MSDVHKAFISHLWFESKEDTHASLRIFNETLDIAAAAQYRLLKANGDTGRLFGTSLSYADISIYGFYKSLLIGWANNKADIVDIVKFKLTSEVIKFICTLKSDAQVARHTVNSISLAAVFA